MRYQWDAGTVTADGEGVAHTSESFWTTEARVRVADADWRFHTEAEGLIAEVDGEALILLERGRLLGSRWRMLGPSGSFALVRTTSMLLGKLCFELERRGETVGAIEPVGPWLYRPQLTLLQPLTHAEAVFLLWAAFRIDARRPLRRLAVGPSGTVASGG